MPSSFLRRHVRGLLRGKFSPSPSLEDAPEVEYDPPTPSNEQEAFFSQCHLAGIDGRRLDFPEVYCGKTGLDIPCIQLECFETDVFASYTGPDGGLTQVGEMRRQPLVRMANLDDEMSLSLTSETDGSDEEEEDVDQPLSAPLKKDREKNRSEVLLGSCSSLLGPNGHEDTPSSRGAERYDWNQFDERRAFGASVSLYEKNPLTGVNAGEPVADVWGVVGRSNNGVLALADGVNWGEGARLAARCAVRGAIDHMNEHIEDGNLANTTEVFHELLASFHSAHSLILQEGGMLTTLCVAVVAPAIHCDSWVLCVCNVGDSLCFVYNRNYGVREVTMGSHDIDQMRDMRDAGGALGPVDGRNPQLHNLTCSMTFVEEGDIVFITSDGVSDNFDPVVGKFCVIKRAETDNKENSQLPPRDNRKLSVATKDSPSREFARPRPCAASLPCVDAASRHELMLIRMRDIIANGIDPPREVMRLSPRREPLFPLVSASVLSHRLIQFATHLSQAKRRTLENPELYKKEKMTKSEQRARRKAVREKIADMPGKLDHASVVAYTVGRRDGKTGLNSPMVNRMNGHAQSEANCLPEEDKDDDAILTRTTNVAMENFTRMDKASCCATLTMRSGDRARATLNVRMPSPQNSPVLPPSTRRSRHVTDYPLRDIVEPRTPERQERPISPYEQLPIKMQTSRDPMDSTNNNNNRRKKHSRGSSARHTLGVDVQWLKRFVGKKDEPESTPPPITPSNEESCKSSMTAMMAGERVSLRQRLRVLLGSNRNLHTHHVDPQIAHGAADKPSRPQCLALKSSCRV
ncbi:unnamed protein product [Cylicocyclus nassatus]|uniref:PPM-type phosphatase domain-containing protein n=1 Tax=Cylicocyclus nassatus TaxID=53992 RepID=A0AA36MFH3_CYLNA|nr:unnamed protein product [Cylicocyclus nassatus]